MSLEQRLRCRAVRQIELHKSEFGVSFEKIETRLFQPRIIVVVDIVDADDCRARQTRAVEQRETR